MTDVLALFFRPQPKQLVLILSWLTSVSLVSLLPEKTCLVALSLRSTVPWCSATWGSVSALTTRTTRWTGQRFWTERSAFAGPRWGFYWLRLCLSAQNSLTRSAPLNSDSQGRFGNRFLTTYDHRFVIKTVSSEDIAEMHNILKKYHQVGASPQPSGLHPASFLLTVLPPPLIVCSLSWSAMATPCSRSSWACTGWPWTGWRHTWWWLGMYLAIASLCIANMT